MSVPEILTFISACPFEIAYIFPSLSTCATDSLLEYHSFLVVKYSSFDIFEDP